MRGNLGGKQVNLSLIYMHAIVELKEKDMSIHVQMLERRELESRTNLWYSFLGVLFCFVFKVTLY